MFVKKMQTLHLSDFGQQFVSVFGLFENDRIQRATSKCGFFDLPKHCWTVLLYEI